MISLALFGTSALEADPILGGLFGGKADKVEKKKVEKKFWSGSKATSIQNKTFPITEWNKHFSSLGSKRAPIAVSEKGEKERFKYKVLERKTVDMEMSRWNERMSDLYKRADIQVDDKAKSIADRRLYNMLLQDTRHYQDIAEELSLRDLNRFQFRRNRTDDGIPVRKAGSGKE